MINVERHLVPHNETHFDNDDNKLTLHDALKNSYADKKTQKQDMKKYGYYRDNQLSNENQQVYYKPDEKKLLVSVTGTHNLKDVGTDAYLAVGKLKDTNRYKEAKDTLDKAKKRYGVDATIVGHSLGGSVGQYIGGSNDKVISLDKGATIGTPTRNNENAYRSAGDAVSLLNANATNTKTLGKGNLLSNHKYAIGGSLFGLPGTIIGAGLDALNSHNVSNIKNEKIFV